MDKRFRALTLAFGIVFEGKSFLSDGNRPAPTELFGKLIRELSARDVKNKYKKNVMYLCVPELVNY